MSLRGVTNEEIGQGEHVHPGTVLQTMFIDQKTDTSTTSNTFTPLFDVTFVKKTHNSYVRVSFSASANGRDSFESAKLTTGEFNEP